MGNVPSFSRHQLLVLLVVILVAGLCVLVPRLLYFAELSFRGLRYLWWVLLLVGGGLWLLFRLGQKR
ncbi:MAG: hypothetical protein A3G75_05065 [Verrucomicrobia bacterium RIFCSPLOWO2_12_FULL_64_8]|nr:MAG: hypothetical protein A3G75_05065 [Verrucomicrobia bacterium RIFCSPLOWO2_12_FULL_64_8]